MAKGTNFSGQPIFTQLINLLDKSKISKASKALVADKYVKRFTSHRHISKNISLIFAHRAGLCTFFYFFCYRFKVDRNALFHRYIAGKCLAQITIGTILLI